MFRLRGRQEDPAKAAAREAIRGWCAEALGASADTSFTISEIACADAACGGVETVVLVMRPGRKTEALKLPGPMAQATWARVLDAVSARPDLWPDP